MKLTPRHRWAIGHSARGAAIKLNKSVIFQAEARAAAGGQSAGTITTRICKDFAGRARGDYSLNYWPYVYVH